MGDVLTIETGLSCNNRCAHCPQPPLRARFGTATGDLDGADIRERILGGLAQGAVEIAFTGGEPTLRRDIADLVAFARTQGARRVSLTTNARMFAYPEFCQRLLDAGLDGISVSLHGPDAATHEALTCVPGSFTQAVTGVATLVRAAAARGRRFDVTSITVLVPSNAHRLRDTLLLAGSLGARLHIVQPFILSRLLLATADRFLLGRQALRNAIEAALSTPLPHGGRVKPYNLPLCDYAHLGDAIEFQRYGLRTARQYRDATPQDDTPEPNRQFLRDTACAACDLACPGIRLEHVPDTDMAAMILEDLDRAWPTPAGRAVRIGSLDLLGPAAFAQVLGGLRTRKVSSISLLWGGPGRASGPDVATLCRTHGVDEVVLIARPTMRQPGGVHAWEPGNLDAIEAFLDDLGGGPSRPALFAVVNHLASDRTHDLDERRLVGLAARIADAGGRRAYLGVPERLDEAGPLNDSAARDALVARIPALTEALANTGLTPCLVANPRAPADPGRRLLHSRAADHLPVVSWDPDFLEHRFAGPAYGWAMWSYPVWVREFAPQDAPEPLTP